MRLYLDEDLPGSLAETLRLRGLDAESAQELGHRGWSDEEQLAYAASQHRTIVSRNTEDFIRIGHAAFERHRAHAGIALFSRRVAGHEIMAMVDGLLRLAELYPKGLGEYDVVYVPVSSETA